MESKAGKITGTVFNIQRFSVHDGTGPRTFVYMKGCPLRCRWCSTPEGLSPGIQVMEDISKCIGCGACLNVCKNEAIRKDVSYLIDRSNCDGCCECAKICPAGAKTICGEEKTVDEVIEIIKRAVPLYASTYDGVTIGGGEMLAQPEFVREVLRRCKEEGISTGIETSGYGSWDELAKIVELCDIIHYDLKEIDPIRHQFLTGAKNDLILENLKKLDEFIGTLDPMPRLILRLPLIKGCNFTTGSMRRVVTYIEANLTNYNLIEFLPFKNFLEQKYWKLGRTYKMEGRPETSPEDITKYASVFKEKGLPVRVATGKAPLPYPITKYLSPSSGVSV
jgi:pyruvate formate lyase activating enzyme